MATKRLRWGNTRISSFSDGRACLIAQFLDTEGNLFEWVPRWAEVQELIRRASNTEVVNKADSKWLGEFAKTANEVFQKVEPFGDAFKVYGKFSRVSDGNLVIWNEDEVGESHEMQVPPAFRMTNDFLRNWLDEHIAVLVVNGFAVILERSIYGGSIRYPEPNAEAVG